ncbi:hypothetical protein [Commensalibacter communis]|nr:hypothetical protein [Commensalibacter communis]
MSYQIEHLITQDDVIIKSVEIVKSLKNKNIIQGVYVDLDQKQCVNAKLLKDEFALTIPDFFNHSIKI